MPKLWDFAKEKSLKFFDDDDPSSHFREVTEIVKQIYDLGLFPQKFAIGCDAAQIADLYDMILEAIQPSEEHFIAYTATNWKLAPAIYGMEYKLASKTMQHNGSALMNWCVGNAKPVQKGNNLVIEKETAGKAKIDPLIAGFNAYELMSRRPEPAVTSLHIPADYRVA